MSLDVGCSKTARGQSNFSGSLSRIDRSRRNNQDEGTKLACQQSGNEVTLFRRFYDRSDLPVALDSHCRGPRLKWMMEIEKLDYHHYLPLFFDGMRDTKEPYCTIANQGARDMIIHAPPNKILNVVPQLIIPIKKALETKNPDTIIRMTQIIQELVKSEELVGEALVPYYRQILPVFNIFINRHKNTGDGILYGQNKNVDLGSLINETVCTLERHGGEDSFINIKYMIPTYESCVLN